MRRVDVAILLLCFSALALEATQAAATILQRGNQTEQQATNRTEFVTIQNVPRWIF